MNTTDLIIGVILLVIFMGIALYLKKAKKKGVHCVGCSEATGCSCSCSNCTEKESP